MNALQRIAYLFTFLTFLFLLIGCAPVDAEPIPESTPLPEIETEIDEASEEPLPETDPIAEEAEEPELRPPGGEGESYVLFRRMPGDAGPTAVYALRMSDYRLDIIAERAVNPAWIQSGISPDGRYIAYITVEREPFRGNPALQVFDLETWEVVHSIQLLNDELLEDDDESFESDRVQITTAILDTTSIAWSPDSSMLAYNAAIDGDSSDVYVLDTATWESMQLTIGSTHSVYVEWSPDGAYILHAAVTEAIEGAGFVMDKIWAVAPDGSEVVMVQALEDSADEIWVGWADSTRMIVYSWSIENNNHNLRLINVASGAIEPIREGTFENVAYDPLSGKLLYTADEYGQPGQVDNPGIFLVTLSDMTEEVIISGVNDSEYIEVNPGAGVFYFINRLGEAAIIGSSARIIPLMNPEPLAFSSVADNGYAAWKIHRDWNEDEKTGIFINAPGGDFTRIGDEVPEYSLWSPDSSRLFIITDDGLYVAEAPEYEPQLLFTTDEIGGYLRYLAWAD